MSLYTPMSFGLKWDDKSSCSLDGSNQIWGNGKTLSSDEDSLAILLVYALKLNLRMYMTVLL